MENKISVIISPILILSVLMLFFVISTFGQLSLKTPGVKWEPAYSFDKCNVFKMEALNNTLSVEGFVMEMTTEYSGIPELDLPGGC